jgi:hypothetical protein
MCSSLSPFIGQEKTTKWPDAFIRVALKISDESRYEFKIEQMRKLVKM